MDFVIGHPRSGTMFLSRLFNVCSPYISGHELLYPLSSDMVWVPSEYYAGRLDARTVGRLLRHYDRRTHGARIDSNWKLTWILPVLLDHFPEARIVHLVREPKENLRSCLALDYYGDLHEHPVATWDKRRCYFLRWMPKLPVPGWDALDPFEKNCRFWTESHRLALTVADRPGRYLRVKIEELERASDLGPLLDFLELKAPPAPAFEQVLATRWNTKQAEKTEVRVVRGGALGPPAEWSAEQLATVEEHCGAMARRLGVG